MRMSAMRRRHRGARISLWRTLAWAFGAGMLCAVMPEAGASDLAQTMADVWAPAAGA
jgi:hypothetical protein